MCFDGDLTTFFFSFFFTEYKIYAPMAHLRKGGLRHHYYYHYTTGLPKLSDRVPLVTTDSAYANTINNKIVGIVT